MKTSLKITYTLTLIILAFIVQRCANPVSPAGGPVDNSPPGFIKAEPPIYSLNFKSDKIRIYFDEFLELKDISNELIVSPPMKKMPDIKLKGKSIIIEFKEPLRKNTTYNIFFGESVTDLTENNPVSNFQYIFSTGDVLDSLSMKGDILSAFNLEPIEGVNIMLYPDIYDTIPFDSVPYLVRPYYLTRSDENGHFILNNLSNGTFKIFALLDVNANLIYDQPNENIAYIDSMVTPWFIEPVLPNDSLQTDSLFTDSLLIDFLFKDSTGLDHTSTDPVISEILATDTLRTDTLSNDTVATAPPLFFSMLLFEEEDTIQRLDKAYLAGKNKIQFVFKTATENPKAIPLNISTTELPKIEELNKTKDTLTLWLLDPEIDSVTFQIVDMGIVLDTVEIAIVKKQRGNKKKKDKTPERPGVKFNLKNGVILPENPLQITFNYPLKTFDTSGVLFIEAEDTLKAEIQFSDSIRRHAIIDFPWKESTKYALIIPDSVITDIIGRSNDSIIEFFRTKPLEDYGNFKIDITVEHPSDFHIMQWIDKNENIIQEILVTADTSITFTNELPGVYLLKLIYDENKNRKWDTGNYLESLQPETIIYYEKAIEVRANWDIEESWKF